MKKAVLIRFEKTDCIDKQTLGDLIFYDNDKKVFECKTLELPDKGNQRRISCIPKGTYKCIARSNEKYKSHYHVKELNGKEVNGRDLILIHHGNYNTDILGCILVGKAHIDINGDKIKDVTASVATMAELVKFGGNEFQLTVI